MKTNNRHICGTNALAVLIKLLKIHREQTLSMYLFPAVCVGGTRRNGLPRYPLFLTRAGLREAVCLPTQQLEVLV